ncbi:MAG: nucleoside recognition domain-containing protein [Thermodesulfobacteriota bacterium]
MQQKPSAINIIWLGMILLATLTAAWTGTMETVTKASFESAKEAVTLAISLIGPMALWLGIMKVAEAGGLMQIVARRVRPLMVRLFPDVPAEHPAMSAMIMNMAANVLGLGNAATPMGIKAMQELEKLAPEKGTATDAMCLFLAINTSSVTLLPLGVITVRAAAGAASPAAILLPSIIATTCSTIVAILAAKMLAAKPTQPIAAPRPDLQQDEPAAESAADLCPPSLAGRSFVWLILAGLALAVAVRAGTATELSLSIDSLNTASGWLIPLLIVALLSFGFFKGVKVYEALTDGAKEGFNTVMRIVPFMVAIFVAIGMFRASGAMNLLTSTLAPLTEAVGMPAEGLAMALLRPLSGSGAFGFMSELTRQAPDSFVAALAGVIQGSSETTFYVLAVYFGSVGVRRTRHALPAALCGETAGVIAAVAVCHLWFG